MFVFYVFNILYNYIIYIYYLIGILNTKKKSFSRDELKDALKKIKASSDDVKVKQVYWELSTVTTMCQMFIVRILTIDWFSQSLLMNLVLTSYSHSETDA